MATTYKKNARNIYKIPFYALFWFWWFMLVLIAGLVTLLVFVMMSKWLLVSIIALWSLVAILTVWRIFKLIKVIRLAGSFSRYRVENRARKSVTKSLLATMTLNRLQDTPYISVPKVVVCLADDHIKVTIEKLAGMHDIDRLSEDVSSSFRGKLEPYAVTSALITPDGNEYKLVLEDVGTDKTWRPATLEEMKQPSHILKLQKGLTINLADKPHLFFYGKSGSGKSTSLISVLIQALMWQSAEIYIGDPKNEFNALSEFYPTDRIAVEIADVLSMLEHVCNLISERQKLVADGVREHQKMGLRAYDLGIAPVVVMIDEVSALMAGMDNSQKKEFLSLITQIAMKGRAVSCFLIFGNQSALAEKSITTDIRGQFATRVVLGKVGGSGEEYRMVFGEVATKGSVERFKGYYLTDGLEQPQLFAVPDLHKHGLNDLKIIKKAFEIGQEIAL
ncbi:FtsK/SpoIIIE domain-containing protein [Streptococcus suis]|nr:FtsK/SpoIIIE domain-containing protein [Streptococcus suis]